MSKKPIEIFKNDKQFQECCRWWQHKLFLDNWFITFIMTDESLKELAPNGERILSGVCEYEFNNKEAKITICNNQEYDEENIIRNISELTIVHELLHLKNEYITDLENEDDKNFHKYIAHQGLEEMAKTLIMTKYNLDYNYFIGSGT